jgi:hypothetical protein
LKRGQVKAVSVSKEVCTDLKVRERAEVRRERAKRPPVKGPLKEASWAARGC